MKLGNKEGFDLAGTEFVKGSHHFGLDGYIGVTLWKMLNFMAGQEV